MIRILLTYVVPIVLPTAGYFLWLSLARRGERRQVPWTWLLGAGALLAAVTAVGGGILFEDTGHGSYVRPPFDYTPPPEPEPPL